ncbi:PDZ-binding protein, CRIPT domain-containing protein [Rozella allomycis CSF55]|uniref:Cysteine-rich PDZ-binding protein n=1 Tax=Rozella allomycis (strain CSF55) TaxID=988480 RepID=A0A075B1Z9_ROZAC|nr:PDZ-binding protein, CRIPT domain-containing protein [Rozella allomycis CSF55]|eukprot:EPZ34833.1 PDZ-binding protein, CRIPT domain-containing protein [Rozella allomycis CSF55]
MVCSKCEKKLPKLATVDTWKQGSRNTIEGGGRKLSENKLLRPTSRNTFMPYQNKCKICKQRVNLEKANYCHSCAYKNGICAICGRKVLDTSLYQQSSV